MRLRLDTQERSLADRRSDRAEAADDAIPAAAGLRQDGPQPAFDKVASGKLPIAPGCESRSRGAASAYPEQTWQSAMVHFDPYHNIIWWRATVLEP